MKTMKKVFALLMALCLALALAGPTLAATSYSITVLGAQANEEYRIYKMMDLQVSSDNSAFSYTVSADWTNFFTTGAGKDYVTLDGTDNHVTWVSGKGTADEMNKFGKAAAAYITDNSVPEAAATQKPASDSDITFTLSEPGYYIITSTNGTRVYIDTTPTDPNPSIGAKNVDPTLEKKVKEGANWGTESYAQIGDTVEFQATIHARKGAKSYVYHDVLSGLALQESTIAITNGSKTLTAGTDYTVTTAAASLTDGCSFEIGFAQSYLDTVADSDIVITYSATLTDDAEAGAAGNKNTAHLTWGLASSTADIVTTTYTLAASAYKYTMKGTTVTPLAGAKFTLSRGEGSGTLRFLRSGTTYRVAADQADAGAVGEIETDATGKFTLAGLDIGTYYLTETVTPTGYNKLAGPVKVVITASSGAATVKSYNYDEGTSGHYDETSSNIGEIRIENGTGTELPSTGGMGTTIFYVVGGILVAGALLLLVTKRRMRDRD